MHAHFFTRIYPLAFALSLPLWVAGWAIVRGLAGLVL
jgi:hypothetical protein